MDFNLIEKHILEESAYKSTLLDYEAKQKKKEIEAFQEKMEEYNSERANLYQELRSINCDVTNTETLTSIYDKQKGNNDMGFDLSNSYSTLDEIIKEKPNYVLNVVSPITKQFRKEEYKSCESHINEMKNKLLKETASDTMDPVVFDLSKIMADLYSKFKLCDEESYKFHSNFSFIDDKGCSSSEEKSDIEECIIDLSKRLKDIKQFHSDKKAIADIANKLNKALSHVNGLKDIEKKSNVRDAIDVILLQLETLQF